MVMFLLISGLTRPAGAQSSDVSDAFWSIVTPTAVAVDIVMGAVLVGHSRDSVLTAFLSNTGLVPVRVDTVYFRGGDAGLFDLVAGFPKFTIRPGGVAAMEFRFSPVSTGIKSSRIVVETQAGELEVLITGEGVAPQFEILTDLIDFGDVRIGEVKDTTITAVVRNASGGSAVVSATELLGPDVTQYSMLSGGGSFGLAAGETRQMQLRFAPSAAGRSSGSLGFSHAGAGSPSIVRLFGNGVAGAVTLMIDTIRAAAGEIAEVPIRLQGSPDLAAMGITGFSGRLRFNASLLAPTASLPPGSLEGGELTIPLDNIPIQPTADGTLLRLPFVATLGDAEGTPLLLEDCVALGVGVTVVEMPGYFLLTDICREGGARLFHDTGESFLRQNRPNPFNATTVIDYRVIEQGPTRLMVMDLLGRVVDILVDGIIPVGTHSAIFDASRLPSGIYLCVMQTPTERHFNMMEVVK